MKWQNLAGVGSVSLFILLAGLFNLSGVSDVQYSPDMMCETECEAYINFTTTYWEFCFEPGGDKDMVYKKMTRSRRLWINMDKIEGMAYTDPKTDISVFVPARGKGNWRALKSGDCLKRTTIANPLPARLKIVGYKDRGETIKWTFNLDSAWSEEVDIDPAWIGWSEVYENKSRIVDDYEEWIVEKDAVCSLNLTSKESVCIKAHNKTEYFKSGTKIEYYNGEVIGLKVRGEEYIGDYVIEDDQLSHFKVPMGDRKIGCLPHEIEKGVCTMESLI